MTAGGGDAEYRAAFTEHVEPAVRSFAPDLLLVSAGFDAHAEDPLGEMELSEAAFRELSQRCAALAPRIAAVLEGGYNLATLPGLVAAAHEGFALERFFALERGTAGSRRPFCHLICHFRHRARK